MSVGVMEDYKLRIVRTLQDPFNIHIHYKLLILTFEAPEYSHTFQISLIFMTCINETAAATS
jgi:hypothetical protein